MNTCFLYYKHTHKKRGARCQANGKNKRFERGLAVRRHADSWDRRIKPFAPGIHVCMRVCMCVSVHDIVLIVGIGGGRSPLL